MIKSLVYKVVFLLLSMQMLYACKPAVSNNSKLSTEDKTLSQDKIKKELEEQIDSIASSKVPVTSCKNLQSQPFVLEFYKKNSNFPVWIGPKGISTLADTLRIILGHCYEDGLDSKQYHLADIEAICNETARYKDGALAYKNLAYLDILLTDAFLTYATQQYAGCIHTTMHNVEWEEHIKSISPIDSLQKAMKDRNLRKVLTNFVCTQPQYIVLKKVLHQYLSIKQSGDWVTMPSNMHLKKGDRGSQVALLYKRMTITGDVTGPTNNSDSVFGDKMEKAVKQYQRTHGLTDNGIIAEQEVKELNKSIDQRIEQIDLNIERCRWLPHNMPQPYVMVNIAGFNLSVMDSNKLVLSMKIVVGKKYRRTPLFKATITFITINPTWEVPEKIAKEEILPSVRKDKNYLTRNNMKIFYGWSQNAPEVSPASVNWDSVSTSRFPYRFSQTPGSWNALGHISFTFPNKYSVYLHDTPNKNLFSRPVRSYSHGCIRIEKPLELAEFLLKNNPGWTKDKIEKVISSGAKKVIVPLKKQVDIYISYWTTWGDNNGEVFFMPDVYGYDADLNNALHSCLHL